LILFREIPAKREVLHGYTRLRRKNYIGETVATQAANLIKRAIAEREKLATNDSSASAGALSKATEGGLVRKI
jgi:hypothetical protein